jgi:hypothetical protein
MRAASSWSLMAKAFFLGHLRSATASGSGPRGRWLRNRALVDHAGREILAQQALHLDALTLHGTGQGRLADLHVVHLGGIGRGVVAQIGIDAPQGEGKAMRPTMNQAIQPVMRSRMACSILMTLDVCCWLPWEPGAIRADLLVARRIRDKPRHVACTTNGAESKSLMIPAFFA